MLGFYPLGGDLLGEDGAAEAAENFTAEVTCGAWPLVLGGAPLGGCEQELAAAAAAATVTGGWIPPEQLRRLERIEREYEQRRAREKSELDKRIERAARKAFGEEAAEVVFSPLLAEPIDLNRPRRKPLIKPVSDALSADGFEDEVIMLLLLTPE